MIKAEFSDSSIQKVAQNLSVQNLEDLVSGNRKQILKVKNRKLMNLNDNEHYYLRLWRSLQIDPAPWSTNLHYQPNYKRDSTICTSWTPFKMKRNYKDKFINQIEENEEENSNEAQLKLTNVTFDPEYVYYDLKRKIRSFKCYLININTVKMINLTIYRNRIEIDSNSHLKIIYLNEIHHLFLRHYKKSPTALEMFISNGKSFFINFPQFNSISIIKLILSLGLPNAKSVQLTDFSSFFKQQGLTVLWQQGQISNYDYLMYLNILSGRSFKDLSQYPIFPWIITDFDSDSLIAFNDQNIRDLRKPIGALKSEKISELAEKFKRDGYMYSFGPSKASTVINDLCKIEPFSSLAKNCQFNSIEELFEQSTSIDSSELPPEFFFDFEFLKNSSLPKWAKSNFHFVYMMRKALESDYVSSNLNHWIDLIWGYKQTGNDAISNINVYSSSLFDHDTLIRTNKKRNIYKNHLYKHGSSITLASKQNESKAYLNSRPNRSFSNLISQQSEFKSPLISEQSDSNSLSNLTQSINKNESNLINLNQLNSINKNESNLINFSQLNSINKSELNSTHKSEPNLTPINSNISNSLTVNSNINSMKRSGGFKNLANHLESQEIDVSDTPQNNNSDSKIKNGIIPFQIFHKPHITKTNVINSCPFKQPFTIHVSKLADISIAVFDIIASNKYKVICIDEQGKMTTHQIDLTKWRTKQTYLYRSQPTLTSPDYLKMSSSISDNDVQTMTDNEGIDVTFYSKEIKGYNELKLNIFARSNLASRITNTKVAVVSPKTNEMHIIDLNKGSIEHLMTKVIGVSIYEPYMCISKLDTNVHVYKTTKSRLFTLSTYGSRISCSCVNTRFFVTIVGTQRGKLIVYSLNKGSIENVIDLHGAQPLMVTVTNGWGFIVCYAQKVHKGKLKHYLFVFSINGERLVKRKIDFEITTWASWTSSKSFDYMVVADEKGKMFAFEVFFGELGTTIYRCQSRIVTLAYLRDINCIIVVTKDGRILFVPSEYQ